MIKNLERKFGVIYIKKRKLNPGIEPEIQVSKTYVITISLIEHY